MKKIIVAMLLMFVPSVVFALEGGQDETGIFVIYNEPTTETNQRGETLPLNDLKETQVWYTIDTSTIQIHGRTELATNPNGGGQLQIYIDVAVANKETKDITFYVYAVDNYGNKSDITNAPSIYVDRRPPDPVH